MKAKLLLAVVLAAESLKVSAPTARAAGETLERLKVLREITGKRRDRLYAYGRYMKALDEGTQPLPQE